jgi:2-oxoisovalerate dehydrogenase E2 component (dihydrolipoyl transacylase)
MSQQRILAVANKAFKAVSKQNVVSSVSVLRTVASTKRSYSAINKSNIYNKSKINTTNIFGSASRSTTRFFASNLSTAASGVVQFKLADVGEGIAEVEILKWFIAEGDTVNEFDPLCEVQTDKATLPITSRYTGKVKKLHYKEGDVAKVGTFLMDIEVSGGAAKTDAPAASAPKQQQQAAKPASTSTQKGTPDYDSNVIETRSGPLKVLAAPAVRHMARKHSIDLSNLPGTGRDGRVRKEDLLNFIQNGSAVQTQQQQSQTPVKAAPAAAAPSVSRTDRVVPLRGHAKVMAQTMTASLKIPHFGYCDEVRMDGLMELRKRMKHLAEEKGVKLSYLPFMIKAASMGLKKYPVLNSSINESLTEITYKASHNIGFATDTPNGLVVPNIKNVQDLSIFEIATELNRLIKAAKDNKLSKNDLTGGTFSLSNIGTIGGTYAKPVIVSPEVCIGALGKIQKLPRFDDHDRVVPMHLMQVSWSADHRVIDGATMANFSNLWKLYLEQPDLMLAELK